MQTLGIISFTAYMLLKISMIVCYLLYPVEQDSWPKFLGIVALAIYMHYLLSCTGKTNVSFWSFLRGMPVCDGSILVSPEHRLYHKVTRTLGLGSPRLIEDASCFRFT